MGGDHPPDDPKVGATRRVLFLRERLIQTRGSGSPSTGGYRLVRTKSGVLWPHRARARTIQGVHTKKIEASERITSEIVNGRQC